MDEVVIKRPKGLNNGGYRKNRVGPGKDTVKALRRLRSVLMKGGLKTSLDPEGGMNQWERIIMNMVYIATSPKHPLSVAAFIALSDRAWGRPKPSAEELDAIGKGGLQLVYVAPPVGVQEKEMLPAPKPDFLEAEFVEEAHG